MGKYMKKSKLTDVAAVVLDLPPHSPVGVRTRAKTLALQRLNDDSAYLQLRSRRLQKFAPNRVDPELEDRRKWVRVSSVSSSSVGSASVSCSDAKDRSFMEVGEAEENDLEFEARDRSTRESTPCSSIREADITNTPSSTSRTQMIRSSVLRNMPSAEEINEFFAYAEQQQQRLFIEKYNYDIVNDLPLPGRYDWVRVSH